MERGICVHGVLLPRTSLNRFPREVKPRDVQVFSDQTKFYQVLTRGLYVREEDYIGSGCGGFWEMIEEALNLFSR